MSRLSKEDWITKGIKVLDDEGYEAIKIDYLCQRFRVTKGSFYHHFDSLNVYEEHLLKRIEADTIGQITRIVNSLDTPKERLNLLTRLVFTVSGKTELSLRAWAMHNRTVKRMLEKMDAERIDVIRKLYMQVGVPRSEAASLARIAHISWLGIQMYHIINPTDKAKSIRLINDMLKGPVKDLSEHTG